MNEPTNEPTLSGRLDLPLAALVKSSTPTGSRVICKPPVTDTDEDWLLHVEDAKSFEKVAEALGWSTPSETDEEYGLMPKFLSYRRGELNLIVTDDREFYAAFDAATYAASCLNLLSKAERIMLFQAVLYGAKRTTEEKGGGQDL